jgi:hypothetical protein
MNDSPARHPERHLEFLRELLVENAVIDGDVFEVGQDAWAIHGVIPVDGEVLLAGFDSCGEANRVLDQLLGVSNSESFQRLPWRRPG